MGHNTGIAPSNRDFRFTLQKRTFVWYYGCQMVSADRYPARRLDGFQTADRVLKTD